MAAYTVTISSLNEKSKGRYRVFHVDNYGKALGIIRMCLKTWGGFGDIVGHNAKCELIDECFCLRSEGIIKIDRKSFNTLWNMAWNFEDESPDDSEDRPTVTYNIFNITVDDAPKKGLISRVLQKIRGLL